jgi:hypothetical protein
MMTVKDVFSLSASLTGMEKMLFPALPGLKTAFFLI